MNNLLTLLRRRKIDLECYLNLTRRLLYESVDVYPEILAQRDKLLAEMAATAAKITVEESAGATGGGDGGYSDDPEVKEILDIINKVKADIALIDAEATNRVKDEMDDTMEQIKQTEKAGRVASYIRKTNFDPTKGKALNTKF